MAGNEGSNFEEDKDSKSQPDAADDPNLKSTVLPPEPKDEVPLWKIRTRKCLDNNFIVSVMTLITIYALFFDDIRMITFDNDKDDIFYGITLFGIIAFALEVLAGVLAVEDYLFSFFFWLDLVSTLSMVPDCGWIWEPITGGGGGNEGAADLAKTSRASKVTRVIRVIRLIRLIRIVKLYKQAKLAQKKAAELRL
jgi:hypothetical protein